MRPVVNGRASICTWDLQFYFRTRKQCNKFLKLYLKSDIPINFSYRQDTVVNDSGITEDRHIIEIDEMPWAANLAKVAEILEKVDYESN